MNIYSILEPDTQPRYGVACSEFHGKPTRINTRRSFLAALGLLLTAVFTLAEPIVVESFTVAGGGGTSTGGTYSLSGTIGQPDAGVSELSGGTYTLQGGFWPGAIIIPIIGGPTLKIEPLGAEVRLSWTPATPGFVLQQSDSLSDDSWTDAPNGAKSPVTLPASEATRFLRLVRR